MIGGLTNLHWIVGDQTMTAFDELQRCFAFPDTARTGDQHTDSVYVYQNAMNRRRWRQPVFQKSGKPTRKYRRRNTGPRYRNAAVIGSSEQLYRRFQAAAN